MPNHELVVDSLGNETNIIYLCNGSIGIYDKAAGTKTLYHGYYDAQGLFQTIMNRGKYVEYNNHRIQRSRTAWMEVWANKLAADYFMKAEGVDWGTYENNHPRKYFLLLILRNQLSY